MGINQADAWLPVIVVVVTVLTVLAIVMLTARRRHVTIADLANGTRRAEFDESVAGSSVAFRLAVGTQLEQTQEAVREHHNKVRPDTPDRGYAVSLPEMNGALISHQDDTLATLLASLDTGPSRSLAAQIQAISQLVARPHGATVTATVYQPEPRDDRLAIAIEVVSPGTRFAQRRVLQEENEPDPGTTPAERIGALLQPAARCAAIELAGWALRRPGRWPSPRGGLRREGLARNMAGLLMNASAEEFESFAMSFCRFAREEFKTSISLLPGKYQPHCNLAIVCEAEGKSATGQDRYKHFKAAVDEYRAAMKDARRLSGLPTQAVQRKIMVRRVRAELVSGIPRFTDPALRWLEAQPLKLEADCRLERPPRRKPNWLWPAGPPRPVLDKQTAECLYNSSCMYALAADAAGRDDWDRHARQLLGAALVLDSADHERYLWSAAEGDPDLRRLEGHFEEFLDCLLDALPESYTDGMDIGDIVKMVDEAAALAQWRPPQPDPARPPQHDFVS